jgi:hypothetical protein
MIFEVVFPFESTIYGDSFKEAIKNFIKLNHNINITKMIIKDQSRQIEANINYYKEDGRNKVGINMFPVGLQYPIPIVTNNTYIPPKMTDAAVISPLMPISPLPLSPVSSVVMPWIPTVINLPNV